MSENVIDLTPMQREQMAGLIQQLNNVRIVAENFVNYFAKEQGVNLQVYQFDTDKLAFVATARARPWEEVQAADAVDVVGLRPVTEHANGQHEM